MKRSVNIGDLISITADDKIPYLNSTLLKEIHDRASLQAVNKKLIEEYSNLSVKYDAMMEYMEGVHPDELKQLYPDLYGDKKEEDGKKDGQV